jgi:predicted ATPase/DNA-binding CsgD family transcriptional regulator
MGPVSQAVARVTGREAEILAALGEHLSNAQIARRLHLSVRTVETHVSSLLRKLDVSDRHALAALAPSLVATAARGTAGVVRGLPATWTPFVGRTRERAELIAALDASRLVTLLGPGGAGKTRLAAEVARELAPTLPLGATFVELVSTRPGFFVQTVAAALGVTERSGQALRDAVLARLRPGRSLLVLDNCEHLVDDTADFLTALLGETTDLLVLTTSRARIGVPGERVVPLSGLSLVAPTTGGAAGSEAVALFFDRARMIDSRFDADPAAVGQLCAQLDGMPLAIELATARSAALGVAGLRAGLTDRLRLLSGGRSGDERHRSLRAVLDWSHELLDDEERTALRRLGRFAGEVDIAAASAVAGQPPAVLADLIGRLADRSLLVHRQGGERWSLLETVRAYALDKLTEAGELDEVTGRYLRWAAGLAADLEDRLERGEPWRAAFDAVADDLRAALGLAEGPAAAPLARALGHLAFARRFLAEARQHYVRAAGSAVDDAEAARDLWSAAGVAQGESKGRLRYELAVAAAERAAAAGDPGTQAAVLAEAVSVATRFPAIFPRDVGLPELRQMLDLAHRVAPPGDVAAAAQLAAADAWTGTRVVDVPDAAPFDAALAAAERADDPVLVSAALDALGSMLQMSGRFAATQELSARRLALLPRLPAHRPRAGSEIQDILHMAVEYAITAGEVPFALDAAVRFGDEALVAAAPHMVESKPMVALVLLGRFDEAVARGVRARQMWVDAGRPAARWLAPSMYALVLCHGLRGDDAAAADWRSFAGTELAGDQTRTVHFQVGGMTSFVEARLALHFGRWDEATGLLAQLPTGPDAWGQTRHWYFDAYPWALAADLAVAAGRPDAAARLAAAEPAARENRWAAACLARTRARLSGDAADLDAAVTAWERLGARYERACTLALVPSRRAEARTELDALGVPMPHDA